VTLSRDARAALRAAGFTRRDFLKRSGVLIVGFSAAGGISGRQIPWGAVVAQSPAPPAGGLDAWLAITADGTVTAYTGKCELGQGIETAQVQLIAEELGVAVGRVRLVQCDTALTPDQGTTSGSQSHPTNFNHRNLAQAGATARAALLGLAAARLGIPVEDLAAADGSVGPKGDPSRRIPYGTLVNGARFGVALDPKAPRRSPAAWTVLGTPIPRVDLRALVAGQLEFVHNVRVPGMLHGRVVRPPDANATLASVDERSVEGIAGLVKVVVKNDFVGIVAEKAWQAALAVSRLKVNWRTGARLPAQAAFYEYLRTEPSRDTLVVDSGDVDGKLAEAATVVKATYLHPYQMHGSMGTSCAVADVQGDRATVWSATQACYPLRSTLATLLGLPQERVRVIFSRGSGCYGINGADTVSYDAAILSQAAGQPVRVQFARRDEMAWENYGLAYVVDQRAGLDSNGTIVAWDHESWSPSLGGRPGYDAPGNVVTGRLLGFQPAVPAPRSPAPPPGGGFANGSNAAPSYVAGCVGGSCGGTGTIRSERVLVHTVRSPFFTGPLRSPNRLQNTFAHESFVDEIAAHLKEDPVAYRLRHLRDPRLIEVVTRAARAASWEARPSPRAGAGTSGVARGRGIACVLYEGDNGYCAMVADVDVDQTAGRIDVKRLVVAQDCGPISTPDGMRNQIEGGALQGLSRALGEEVTWDSTKVTSVDWRTYRSLSLGADVPIIESVLIDRRDVEAMGAGETTITVVAAAVGNAVFDATGARLRQVPFTPDRLKAALASRAPVSASPGPFDVRRQG
jgi:CO/xanthine dehydrogenase Mo-binding subunit